MTTNYSPLSNPDSFAKALPERITYLEGMPRNYRFNAKRGNLNFEDEKEITAGGSAFSLLPLAIRVFRAPLFKGPDRLWLEIFFLNKSGHLCGVLFHSSSVDRFYNAAGKRMVYDRVSPLGSLITVRPLPRMHPEHGPYFVADFTFEDLPTPAQNKAQEIRQAIPPIYRRDTVTHPETMLLQEGYQAPDYEAQSTEITNHAPA
ncbi:hypothetical protein [Neolewinella agarilytica]|uniref:Uncharacterized protein n=1 Tax=Neolewinella agarilytica TaxID=478744 RepID=A0A1H9HEM5_9BACT|nr:hypothetical protein [Neolewinella agarilytica]SEQ60789.1 hypothetical protein SAMN05444359_112130 [Neolewinella agarilytica]